MKHRMIAITSNTFKCWGLGADLTDLADVIPPLDEVNGKEFTGSYASLEMEMKIATALL